MSAQTGFCWTHVHRFWWISKSNQSVLTMLLYWFLLTGHKRCRPYCSRNCYICMNFVLNREICTKSQTSIKELQIHSHSLSVHTPTKGPLTLFYTHTYRERAAEESFLIQVQCFCYHCIIIIFCQPCRVPFPSNNMVWAINWWWCAPGIHGLWIFVLAHGSYGV